MDCLNTMILLILSHYSLNIVHMKAYLLSFLIYVPCVSTVDYQKKIKPFNLDCPDADDDIVFDQINQIENLIELRHDYFEEINDSFDEIRKGVDFSIQESIELDEMSMISVYFEFVDLYYCSFEKNSVYNLFRDTVEASSIIPSNYKHNLFDLFLYLNDLLLRDLEDFSDDTDEFFSCLYENYFYCHYIFSPMENTFAEHAMFVYCKELLFSGKCDKENFIKKFKNQNIITIRIKNEYILKDLNIKEWKSPIFIGSNNYFRVFWLLDINGDVVGNISTLRNTNNSKLK